EERYGKPVLSKDALVNAMLANAGPNEPVLAQQVLEAAFKDVATAAKSFQEARDQADRLKQRAAQKPGDLDLRREHNRLMDEAIRAFAAYDEMRERWKGRIRVRDEAFQRAGKEMTAEQLRVLPADITFIRSDAPALTDMFPVQQVLESQSELARLRIAIEKEGFFSAMKPAERESLPADVMKHRRVLEEAERKFGYQAPELKDLPSMGELQQLVLKRSLAGDKFLPDAVEPTRPQRTSAGTPIPPPPGSSAPGGGVISFLADFRVSGRPLTDNVMYRPSALRSSLELNALSSDSAAGFIAAPLTPGPELEIVATRLNGGGPLYVAVTIGSQLVVVAFDALGGGPGKYIMGLARFDGQNLGSPLYTGPTAPCPRFQRLAPTKITFRMEGEELVVKVAGRDGFRYKPTLKRQPPPDVFSNTKGATICVGCSKSIFNIDQVNFHPTPKP
ncbi:MAG TPA: hypothetical protein PLV92_04010, partial [Pirellulaceae bacterium]|nr:hypothetical protein [Pirellulaceae bacterium]